MWRFGLAVAVGVQFGCAGYTRDSGGLGLAGLAAGAAAVTSLPALNDSPNRAYSCPESCPADAVCNHTTGLCNLIGPGEQSVHPEKGTAEASGDGPWVNPPPTSIHLSR